MVSPIKIRGLHEIQPSNDRFFFLDQWCYCNDNFDYTRKIDWNSYQCNDTNYGGIKQQMLLNKQTNKKVVGQLITFMELCTETEYETLVLCWQVRFSMQSSHDPGV